MNAKAFTRVKPTSIASIAVLIALLVLSSQVPIIGAVPPAAALLDPKTIPKYVNQLTGPPPVYTPEFSNTTDEFYTVSVTEFTQQILPSIPGLGLLPTTVWGYGGLTGSGSIWNAPGPTFEATRGKEIYVRYRNDLAGLSHLFAVVMVLGFCMLESSFSEDSWRFQTPLRKRFEQMPLVAMTL